MRLTGERNYALISVVLGKDISEASVNRIFDLADGNLINDNREEKMRCQRFLLGVPTCSIRFSCNYFSYYCAEHYEQYFHGRIRNELNNTVQCVRLVWKVDR